MERFDPAKGPGVYISACIHEIIDLEVEVLGDDTEDTGGDILESEGYDWSQDVKVDPFFSNSLEEDQCDVAQLEKKRTACYTETNCDTVLRPIGPQMILSNF